MNDLDRYRKLVLGTTMFEATLNQMLKNGTPIIIPGNIYKTIHGQQIRPVHRNGRKSRYFGIKYRSRYRINEKDKWWKS